MELLDERGRVLLCALRKRGESGRNVQRLVGAPGGSEVIAGRKSGVNAVALPLMLHEACAGIKVESVGDHVLGNGRGVLAGLVEASLLALRPQAVEHECDVTSGAAFAGVAGVGGAEVGCPGKRQEIVVEVSGGCLLRIVAVRATRRGRGKKRCEQREDQKSTERDSLHTADSVARKRKNQGAKWGRGVAS